jgi:hypothetical protein
LASRRVRKAVRNAKIIIQSCAPVLTGNLQQNAIQTLEVSNGYLIFVSDLIAPYGAYLDEGKVAGKGQQSVGWFSEKGFNAIGAYVEATNNGRKTNLRSAKSIVSSNSKDTLARQTTYTRNILRGG